jgi:hypothetical protein
MTFISQNQLESQKLITLYKSCDAVEQASLLVLGVVGGDIYQAKFKLLLTDVNKNEVFASLKRKLEYTTDFKAKMLKQGLLSSCEKGIFTPPHLRHHLTKLSLERGIYEQLFALICKIVPTKLQHDWGHHSIYDRERHILYLLHTGQFEECEPLFDFGKDPQEIRVNSGNTLVRLCFYPFDQDFFITLPPEMRYQAFVALFIQLRNATNDNAEVIVLLQSLQSQGYCDNNMQLLLGEQYLLAGQKQQAKQLIEAAIQSHYRLALNGWLAFDNGDFLEAIALFEQSIKAKYKLTRKRNLYVARLPGLFYMLALLKAGFDQDITHLTQLSKTCEHYNNLPYGYYCEIASYRSLHNFAKVLRGIDNSVEPIDLNRYNEADENYSFDTALLINALCIIWSRGQLTDECLHRLGRSFDRALIRNDLWYAQIAAQIITEYDNNKAARAFLDSHSHQGTDFLTLVKKKEAWLQALDKLISLKRPSADDAKNLPNRLIWVIDTKRWPYDIEPRIQKKGKKGWLKGKPLQLKQLINERDTFDYLTLEDEQLIQAIEKIVPNSSYNDESYRDLSGYGALKAAMGHPNLYPQDGGKDPIEIIEVTPELLITQSAKGYKISMPSLEELSRFNLMDKKRDFTFTKQNQTQYELMYFDGLHLEIADIIGDYGLEIPADAKNKVIQSIRSISPFLNIQSDIVGIDQADTGMNKIEPDLTLYINVHLEGVGLQMDCHVQPLGAQGPTLIPGSGNPMVVAMIEGERTVTNRDLEQEKQLQKKLIEICPLFGYMADNHLILDDFEDGLNTLEQLYFLQNAGDDPKLVLQWPKGQPVQMSKPVHSQQMSMTVGKHKDWFSLEGQLMVTDEEVIDLKQLLKMIEQTDSRFIPIEENTYLVLTERLRRQLQKVANASDKGKFHALAAPLIDDATQGMTLKTDNDWRQVTGQLRQSFELQPKLPPTLQAQLRDYQIQGYEWACRLAHWGAGACLADDMGLGKTLQALAVILARTTQGPTLVLAPTSVCFNWRNEAHRFAPTLNVKLLGPHNRQQRLQLLEQAKPYDLIICSYGLLQTEGEQLQKVKWQTIIADEAQALKNPQAKRTQMAMKLDGAFKMITTGTPIENNLVELWSLFRFINPGLLGSKEQFGKKFVSKIEDFNLKSSLRKVASKALKQQIAPFILRRLKSEVLTELPSRTEVNLHVEMSYDEMALYEALRQQSARGSRQCR